MSIKEMILKTGGIWKITYINNYKIVIDLNNNSYDTFDFYNVYGVLENELTTEKFNQLFRNIKECKKIK